VADALPALAARAPSGLQRFPGTAMGWDTTAAICAALHRDGAVVLERAASGAACDSVVAEMSPYVEAAGFGDGFLGRHTRRAGACVSRSAAACQLIQHPLVLRICQGVMGRQILHARSRDELDRWLAPGNQQLPFQLSLSQVICIGPDERPTPRAQPMHRDGWGFIMDWQQQIETEVSMIWALQVRPHT
jgi:hypothetical protein